MRVRRVMRLGLTVAFLAAAVDQAVKAWVVGWLMAPPTVIKALPVLDLVLIWNRGVSFGLFNRESAYGRWILTAVAAVVIAVLLIWLRRGTSRFEAFALGLVIGGAVGNVIDRWVHGAVVDYLYFHLGGHYWPAFNLADAAITVGVALLLYDALFRGRRSHI